MVFFINICGLQQFQWTFRLEYVICLLVFLLVKKTIPQAYFPHVLMETPVLLYAVFPFGLSLEVSAVACLLQSGNKDPNSLDFFFLIQLLARHGN